jgi:hypothetical protein
MNVALHAKTSSPNGWAGYFQGGSNYFDGDIGIGTTTIDEMLHIENYSSGGRAFLKIESSHLTNWHETGLRIRTPQNMWHLRMDDDTNNNLPVGALGLRSQDYQLEVMTWQENGNVGIGTTTPATKLDVRGNIRISDISGDPILELGEGLDYAEGFDVADAQEIAPGSVLIIDPDNPGKLTVTGRPYDSKVAGIVAGAKGQGSGVRLGTGQFDHDVALAGRVYCNVDASVDGVEPGDLLTTSATPGYAMKATDYVLAQGAILGKAMEKLEQGQKGQILVLVTLQ